MILEDRCRILKKKPLLEILRDVRAELIFKAYPRDEITVEYEDLTKARVLYPTLWKILFILLSRSRSKEKLLRNEMDFDIVALSLSEVDSSLKASLSLNKELDSLNATTNSCR